MLMPTKSTTLVRVSSLLFLINALVYYFYITDTATALSTSIWVDFITTGFPGNQIEDGSVVHGITGTTKEAI